MNTVRITIKAIFVLLLLFGFAPLAAADQSHGFKRGWAPVNQMDNQLFPAKILAEAMLNNTSTNPDFKVGGVVVHPVGDPNGSIGIAIGSDQDNAQLHIELKIGNFSQVTIYDGILEKGGEGYLVYPKILWNYEVLERQKYPATINAEFVVSINGSAPEKKIQTYRVRSINDVPYAIRKPDGDIQQLPWMWGAFVNENHPWIDQLLREALNTNTIVGFNGYQRSQQDVINQVFAIWYAMQSRGFRYSNITTPSGESKQVYSQHVRFFEDSINTSQANCVDGTVMFASILRKIGIDPILMLIPEHMFLGFWLDQQHTRAAYLETTAMGSVNLNNFPRDNSMGSAFKASRGVVSNNSYNEALRIGSSRAATARLKYLQNDPNYEMIDISGIRAMGIQPINH